MDLGADWLALPEVEKQKIRDEVRAQHIAQGLGSEPDPVKLAATVAIIERAQAVA